MERIKDSGDYAVKAARLLLDKKAEDAVIYDVRKITSFTDYIIIATVNSSAQLEASARELRGNLGVKPDHTEGGNTGGWTLVDYGSFIVNLFYPEQREFYGLERIWGDAEKVEL